MWDAFWKQEISNRFSEREDLTKDEFYARFYADQGVAADAVHECLDLIRIEWGISPGILRPDDRLEVLFAPVKTRNPWRWLIYQVKYGDSLSEIEVELSKRMKQHGAVVPLQSLENVDDLICAWAGQRKIIRI